MPIVDSGIEEVDTAARRFNHRFLIIVIGRFVRLTHIGAEPEARRPQIRCGSEESSGL